MTNPVRKVVLLSCLAVLLGQPLARADGSFDTLLQRLPSETNAVLAIDARAILKSPIAKRERWADKRREDFLAGVTALPPNTRRLVIGAQVDPTTMQNVFKIGLAQVPGRWNISQLAEQLGGSMDKIGTRSVVLTRHGGYGFVVAPGVLGGMRPANRQAFSRWSRFASSNNRIVLSRYLRQAMGRLDENHQVVMALDTTDMFDLRGIRQRLESIRGLTSSANLDHVAAVVSGLQGVTLTIGVKEQIHGELRFQFSQPVGLTPEAGKTLVLQTFDAIGAHVDDLDTWKAKIVSEQLILNGSLTRQAARQLLSPLDPSATATQAESLSNEPLENQDPKVVATQRYFHSVTTLLRDLRDEKTKNWAKSAYWYNQCAQRIDDLPMLNVDPDALAFGASVSQTLRGLAIVAYNTGRGIQYTRAQAALVAVDLGGNYYYRYGINRFGYPYGYTYYQPNIAIVSNADQIRNLMAVSANTELALRLETWKNIDNTRAELRRKLVARYRAEF